MGARKVSIDEFGNASLILNADSPMGKRGESLKIFKDNGIYTEVLKYGKVEDELSQFIANVINSPKDPVTLIDLGANCGIISKQVLERLDKFINILAVEPLHELCLCLASNLKKFEGERLNLIVLENALVPNGIFQKEIDFFIDSKSVGNFHYQRKLYELRIPRLEESRR